MTSDLQSGTAVMRVSLAHRIASDFSIESAALTLQGFAKGRASAPCNYVVSIMKNKESILVTSVEGLGKAATKVAELSRQADKPLAHPAILEQFCSGMIAEGSHMGIFNRQDVVFGYGTSKKRLLSQLKLRGIVPDVSQKTLDPVPSRVALSIGDLQITERELPGLISCFAIAGGFADPKMEHGKRKWRLIDHIVNGFGNNDVNMRVMNLFWRQAIEVSVWRNSTLEGILLSVWANARTGLEGDDLERLLLLIQDELISLGLLEREVFEPLSGTH